MTFDEQQQRLQALIEPVPLSVTRFGPNSRYHGFGTKVLDADGDRPVIYVKRRLVPHPEELATIAEHVVLDGERPDHIAATALGDPELFWRLCDANRAIFPAELVAEIGRRLRVALPAGIPGVGQ